MIYCEEYSVCSNLHTVDNETVLSNMNHMILNVIMYFTLSIVGDEQLAGIIPMSSYQLKESH